MSKLSQGSLCQASVCTLLDCDLRGQNSILGHQHHWKGRELLKRAVNGGSPGLNPMQAVGFQAAPEIISTHLKNAIEG